MENQKKINNKISGGNFLKEFQSQAPSEIKIKSFEKIQEKIFSFVFGKFIELTLIIFCVQNVSKLAL